MQGLIDDRNLNKRFEDLFSLNTDQERGITTAMKDTFSNLDFFLQKTHIR